VVVVALEAEINFVEVVFGCLKKAPISIGAFYM